MLIYSDNFNDSSCPVYEIDNGCKATRYVAELTTRTLLPGSKKLSFPQSMTVAGDFVLAMGSAAMDVRLPEELVVTGGGFNIYEGKAARVCNIPRSITTDRFVTINLERDRKDKPVVQQSDLAIKCSESITLRNGMNIGTVRITRVPLPDIASRTAYAYASDEYTEGKYARCRTVMISQVKIGTLTFADISAQLGERDLHVSTNAAIDKLENFNTHEFHISHDVVVGHMSGYVDNTVYLEDSKLDMTSVETGCLTDVVVHGCPDVAVHFIRRK